MRVTRGPRLTPADFAALDQAFPPPEGPTRLEMRLSDKKHEVRRAAAIALRQMLGAQFKIGDTPGE